MKSKPAVATVQEFADQQISRLKEKTAAAGHPITCAKGCFYCCYEPVYCDSREIEHALASLDAEQLDYVKARTAQWIRIVEPSGLLKTKTPSAFAWRTLRVPCPFLRGNLCLIYDRRPVSCRLHLAIGDPKNCEDDQLRKTQMFCFSPEMIEHVAFVSVAKYKGGNVDHLGAWLALRLFGLKLNSAARAHISKSHSKFIKLTYA